MIHDLRTIAAALGGDLVGGQVIAPGPGHSHNDRSLSIRLSDTSPFGFVAFSHAGDDWRLCRDFVLERLGISPDKKTGPRPASAAGRHEPDDKSRTERAISLWKESADPRGSLVEAYLASRALVLPVELAGGVIRFHPRCPFGTERHPCLVALMRDVVTDEPRAIIRTALTPAGQKIDRKMLGPKAGATVKLSPDEAVTTALTVGEGIETTLAAMALGFAPAWACGDAGAIRAFPVLPGIESLTIAVDRDKSGTGQQAAIECSARWTNSGREVFRVIPTRQGEDLNDVLRLRAAAA
jgi:putative DNA primase/helicase